MLIKSFKINIFPTLIINDYRAKDKVFYIYLNRNNLLYPMFDNLLETSWWYGSNKWTSVGFREEIYILETTTIRITWVPSN